MNFRYKMNAKTLTLLTILLATCAAGKLDYTDFGFVLPIIIIVMLIEYKYAGSTIKGTEDYVEDAPKIENRRLQDRRRRVDVDAAGVLREFALVSRVMERLEPLVFQVPHPSTPRQ